MNSGLKTHYFLNKKFVIYEGTYIPHFETEYMITKIEKYSKANSLLSILEVGTGSGCISIALKQRNKELTVTTIEKDLNVYNNAIHNIALHRTNVTCLNVSLNLIDKINCDIVFSNPPYIKTEEAIKLAAGDKNIMRNIDGGKDGLSIVREVLNRCIDVKYCIFELGYPENQDQLKKEFESKWKIIEYEQPLVNQNVYFCILENTRYWT